MNVRLLNEAHGPQTFAVVFAADDEVVAGEARGGLTESGWRREAAPGTERS